MSLRHEYRAAFTSFLLFGVLTLAVNIWYYAYPLWERLGFTHPAAVSVFLRLRRGGLFDSPLTTKGLALLLGLLALLPYRGRRNRMGWLPIAFMAAAGCGLYFSPFRGSALYAAASVLGYAAILTAESLSLYRLSGGIRASNDLQETFEQCGELVDTPNSVNLPTRYKYKGKEHRGWINIVNPFRGTLVLGTPGSGKSYSVYLPMMEQMMRKGYTLFVYDYKYPSLTRDAYNMLLQNADSYRALGMKRPRFCVVNFNDPRYSLRCNPLNSQYIRSLTDCTEIADVIMKNLAETDRKDFFTQSAQLYIDCCASFLWVYEGGRYCSFPHLVELMCRPAEHVIELISRYPELKTKVASFQEALHKKANEQLAGQTSSATVPLAGMSTPSLYWVLSGDDFRLDINSPDDPKVVCVGNDPDNQATYGAALALFFSRLFKLVNHPGLLKSAILLDEAPTVVIKGLDNLIATARSNKVAVVLGGQDKTQFVRDYGEKYANVIFNTVGNILSGQVNGRTAEELSRTFGREFRERRSLTESDDSDSMQFSFQQDELLPASRIETLSQGTFFGKVADDFGAKIERKLFCGEIVVDKQKEQERKGEDRPLPRMTDFGEDAIRKSILEGGLREAALKSLAAGRLRARGMRDTITDSDIAEELSKVGGNEKREYLEAYAEEYIQEHIRKVIEDNYRRIQDEIQGIMEAHGIGLDNGKSAAPGPEPQAQADPIPETAPQAPVEEDEPEDFEDGIYDEEPPEEYWSGEDEYVE